MITDLYKRIAYHINFFFCNNIIILFSFSEPTTEILGGPELFIDQGSTINLTCLIQFAPEPPPTVGWTHEKQVSETILTKKNSHLSN
jgi:hypothetical protein